VTLTRTRDYGIQALSIVVLVAVWAVVAAQVGDVVPGPLTVAPALADLVSSGTFLGPLLQSLFRTVLGFACGFVIGVTLGIASGKVGWFALTASPLLNVVLFAPTLVVIFLGIAMLGTQIATIAIITSLVVAPNVAIYMRDAMRDFDHEIVAMADSFHASRRQRVRDLYLPYLVPPVLAASRIGFSMSWKVVMLSEVFGFPGGLGFQIRINYTVYDLTTLLAWLLVFVIALLVIEQAIRFIERRVVRWQP
jgi:NitT/TauT family transport system permease protein